MEYLIQNEQGSQKKKSDEGSSTPTRCVWNLLTIFVVLNTMISIALLGITIAFVTRVTKTVETSAQGIVPGTIFPVSYCSRSSKLGPKVMERNFRFQCESIKYDKKWIGRSMKKLNTMKTLRLKHATNKKIIMTVRVWSSV